MIKKSTYILSIVIVAIVTLIGTFVLSNVVWFLQTQNNRTITFNSDVSKENVMKFMEVRKTLHDDFYKEVENDYLLESAIAGMANSLDNYTFYLTKEQMEEYNERHSGEDKSYVGIGVHVGYDENKILVIKSFLENSPAKEAGVKVDDKIYYVNGEDVRGQDDQTIIGKIKGEEDTFVKVKFYRPSEDKEIEFNIQRKKIVYETSIVSNVMENNIGYINIRLFDTQIDKKFNDELDNLLKKNIKGLIIDLRDDPGGSFSKCKAIADRLLPEVLIVSTKSRKGVNEKYYSDDKELDLPMVVLINERSASASEILAGALKDNNKAKIVGKTSFGKGLVQEVRMFEDGSGFQFTVSEYFTPSGRSIHEKGVKPDYEVFNDEKYDSVPVQSIEEGEDKQLNKALELLVDAA